MNGEPRAEGALAEALRGSVAVLRGVLLLALAGYLGSGFYVVRQNELAVELLAGRALGLGDGRINRPGLHLAWPAPLGEVRRVDVGSPRVARSEAFWYHRSDEERATGRDNAPGPTLRPGIDGYLLTADRAILHARWEAVYRIVDPVRYLLGASDPDAAVRLALEAAAARAAVELPLDAALADQAGLRDRVAALLSERLTGLNLGVRLEQVRLAELIPPRQVREAFDAAAKAAESRQQELAEASAYAASRQGEAAAEAARIVALARAEKTGYVARVQAAADQVTRLLPDYRANPTAFRARRQAEAVRAALERAEVVIVPRGQRFELRVNRRPKAPAAPAAEAQP